MEQMRHVGVARLDQGGERKASRQRGEFELQNAHAFAPEDVHQPADRDGVLFGFQCQQPAHVVLRSPFQISNSRSYTAHRSSKDSSSSTSTGGGSTTISPSEAPGGTMG